MIIVIAKSEFDSVKIARCKGKFLSRDKIFNLWYSKGVMINVSY